MLRQFRIDPKSRKVTHSEEARLGMKPQFVVAWIWQFRPEVVRHESVRPARSWASDATLAFLLPNMS